MSSEKVSRPKTRFTHKSAIISKCGLYRYELRRVWRPAGQRPRAATWVMLNPSTADSEKPDPTLKKCVGFSRIHGFTELTIVNLYAYRATNPKDLKRSGYKVGPSADPYIIRAVQRADTVFAAWGGLARRDRAMEVLSLLGEHADCPVVCFGFTQNGHPCHPLMLAYKTPLEELDSSNEPKGGY